MKTGAAALLATVAGLAFLALVIFGGWQMGWWFTQHNTDRQYSVNVHSQQYQAAEIAQLRDNVQGYDASDNDAQKAQIKATFCAVYPNLTQPPVDLTMAAGRLGC